MVRAIVLVVRGSGGSTAASGIGSAAGTTFSAGRCSIRKVASVVLSCRDARCRQLIVSIGNNSSNAAVLQQQIGVAARCCIGGLTQQCASNRLLSRCHESELTRQSVNELLRGDHAPLIHKAKRKAPDSQALILVRGCQFSALRITANQLGGFSI